MKRPLEGVQRIVLHGTVWAQSRHLVLGFPKGSHPLAFLHALKPALWPTPARLDKPDVQLSLGFSRRGLENAHVPKHVLVRLAQKAPAFYAGAALRAGSQLGAKGSDAPSSWDEAFGFMSLDAVLSVHAKAAGGADAPVAEICEKAKAHGVRVCELPMGQRLPRPPGIAQPQAEVDPSLGREPQWVHFGYRDGLARIGIEGWTEPAAMAACKPASRHPAGEFLLGHPQRGCANPWIAGPGATVWPEKLRAFFADGSFGVLQQIEQHVKEFEDFVQLKAAAPALGMTSDEIKAKLCGRRPDGTPLAADTGARPEDDFDYRRDGGGHRCPLGSHIRRMNPRGDSLAHAGRARPLLRRGMAYGPAWKPGESDEEPRGLIGQFFCASIEDQFEHLIGQWADRVPLGSQDRGRARDPLIGAHEAGDGVFVMPRRPPLEPLELRGLRAFTRTRGIAYLFYPSLHALAAIADNSVWGALDEDDA